MNAFRSRDDKAARAVDLLPPERLPRAPRNPASLRTADIIDAEFEIVPRNSRRILYPVFNDSHGGPKTVAPDAVASDAGGVLPRFERLLQTASPKGFAILVTGLCAPVFLLFAGLPHTVPAVASLSPLSISNVTTAIDDANGLKILSVEGAVENRSDAPKTMPTLLVDIIAGGQKRTVSRIASAERALFPGESRPFSARLLHTGGKLPEVAVSFGQPGDSAP